MKIPKLTKKALVLISTAVVLGSITGAVTLNKPQSIEATETLPIVQQVDNQGKQLANHEARISNSENDIKSLQGSTNTNPSSSRLVVPDATPSLAPTPNPVSVATFERISLDAINIDCKYTYSDDTIFQWHWQTAGQDSWVTDGVGQNGHWVHTTQTSGSCDQSVIGQTKTN